jgi:hypothetical protein
MRAFAVVLAVALGPASELYRAYKTDVVDTYDSIQPKLETLAESHPFKPVYAQLLCWLQLHFQEYWAEVEGAEGRTPLPNFRTLYEAIRYKQWHRPEIPVGCLLKKKAKPAATGLPASGGGNVSTNGGPAPGAAAAATTKHHTYLRNDSPNASLEALGTDIGKIYTFLRMCGDGRLADVPKTDLGIEMCLAYQTRGGCYKDCGRHTGHLHLNKSEVARLCEFIKKDLQRKLLQPQWLIWRSSCHHECGALQAFAMTPTFELHGANTS